jgi:hypothetical protein
MVNEMQTVSYRNRKERKPAVGSSKQHPAAFSASNDNAYVIGADGT